MGNKSLGFVLVCVISAVACSGNASFSQPANEATSVSADVPQVSTSLPPSTTTSTASSLPSPVVPPPVVITMVFTGDIIPHGKVVKQAKAADGSYNFVPMFNEVRPFIEQADIAICHLETPVRAGREPHGYPAFNAPVELLEGLQDVGYDGCSTASNHSMDQGAAGVYDTVEFFDGVGLKQAGMNVTGKAMPAFYEVEGKVVAHLSYTYGLNGHLLPADEQLLVGLIDAERILEDSAAASKLADYVVVSLHWGQEYQATPTEAQTELAESLTLTDDIDLIVGHHAHTLQPSELVNGTWVVYGLGNFLSNQSRRQAPGTQDGVIMSVSVTFDEHSVSTDLAYVPTWVNRDTYTIEVVYPDSHAAVWERTHNVFGGIILPLNAEN